MQNFRSQVQHDKAADEFRPGVYGHYKGGKYTALFLARAWTEDVLDDEYDKLLLVAKHHETRENRPVYVTTGKGICIQSAGDDGDFWVIYVSHTTGAICARPLATPNEDSWIDPVDWVRKRSMEGKSTITEVRPRFDRLPEDQQPT